MTAEPIGDNDEWPDYLTVAEAAAILRLAPMSVYREVRSGNLPSARFGRIFRIRKTDFAQYIAEREGSHVR